MLRTSVALAVFLAACGLAISPAEAKKKDKPPVPSADKPEDVKKGKTALLKAPKGMRYFLRVPKKYDAKKESHHGCNAKKQAAWETAIANGLPKISVP